MSQVALSKWSAEQVTPITVVFRQDVPNTIVKNVYIF